MIFPTISRFFEDTPKPSQQSPNDFGNSRLRLSANSEMLTAPTWPEIDRRARDTRRMQDRREKQHATFLETRKIQGRRRSSGRRKSDRDAPVVRFHISVKG